MLPHMTPALASSLIPFSDERPGLPPGPFAFSVPPCSLSTPGVSLKGKMRGHRSTQFVAMARKGELTRAERGCVAITASGRERRGDLLPQYPATIRYTLNRAS